MLKAVDPFLPSSKRWSVATVSTFFGTSHPWARGAITCPGGCEIDFYNTDKTRDGSYADLKLVHDGSSTHTLEPTNDHQLIALWASETFSGELQRRSNHHYESFHTELSYRTIAFFRDSNFTTLIPHLRLPAGGLVDVRTWADIFPAPLPVQRRLALDVGTISFASTHCHSESGREEYIRDLQGNGIPVNIFGRTCLSNQPAGKRDRRYEQNRWRFYKYHLAFENNICVDYFTEKALVAFLNGQVPIIYGAPNVHEFLPPNSYIDITAFSSIAELAAYLRHLESHPEEYGAYHQWREASIWTYGVNFRTELIKLLGLLDYFKDGSSDDEARESEYFRCSMCSSLDRWARAHDWVPPFSHHRVPRGILGFSGSCTAGWRGGKFTPLPGHCAHELHRVLQVTPLSQLKLITVRGTTW